MAMQAEVQRARVVTKKDNFIRKENIGSPILNSGLPIFFYALPAVDGCFRI